MHIIEKYFQEILHCFTMTNIRCKGGKEIDLLAIDPKTSKRYHVEARVSTTFKLKLEATSTRSGKSRKDVLDHFVKEKFEHPHVLEKIHEILGNLPYTKWIVVWEAEGYPVSSIQTPSVVNEAKNKFGIEVHLIGDLLNRMINEIKVKGSRDDVLRMLELISIGVKEKERRDKYLQKRREMVSTIKKRCPNCGCVVRIPVHREVEKTQETESGESMSRLVFYSSATAKCKKCGKNIAELGDIVKTVVRRV